VTSRKNRISRGIALVVGIAGVASCGRIHNLPSTTTLTAAEDEVASPRRMPLSESVTRLTEVRCKREADCKNVGSVLGYPDRDACIRGVQDEIQNELRPDLCLRGVEQRKLFACLGEARAELCSAPRQDSRRLMSCKHGELCS
jgi:hypothetical protein